MSSPFHTITDLLRKFFVLIRREGLKKTLSRVSLTLNHYLKLDVVPYGMEVEPAKEYVFTAGAPTIAIHLHLFYSDMVVKMVDYLSNVPFAFDLYVSTHGNANIDELSRQLASGLARAQKIVVERVPNRGRDIAPFIVQFGSRLLAYDIISHIHTKKSAHRTDLDGWFASIMEMLYGSESRILKIIQLLGKKGKIVYPEGYPNLIEDTTGWCANREWAAQLLKKYTDYDIERFPSVEFPQGCMFWARAECMKEFLSFPLTYADFPEEPILWDGTIAHALERLILIVASRHKGKCYRIYNRRRC